MIKKLNIALVQSHLHWENPIANRTMFEEKIEAISRKVDMIVLPEMFTTGFTMAPHNIAFSEGVETIKWMRRMARKVDAAVVGSSIFHEEARFFNRLHFVQPDGGIYVYDKRHTFTLAGEDGIYQPGKEKVYVEFRGFRFYPLICYDLRFPVWSRNTVNYDVLIYVANWAKPRIGAWDALLKARAIENMAYCLGVNRTGFDGLGHEYPGHSAAYDVLGEQLTFSQKEEIVYATLKRDHINHFRRKLRFLEDRDGFSLK